MNFTKVTCLDLEMCCWNDRPGRSTGEIIEIGLAVVDLEIGQIIKRGQYFVLPEKDDISPFCTELTSHTASIIQKQGRPLAAALDSVVDGFGGKSRIYASWGRDDLVLQEECAAKGITYPFKEWLNISTLFKMQRRIKNQRFGHRVAMEMLDLPWEGRQHVAYVDAYNLAHLVSKIL